MKIYVDDDSADRRLVAHLRNAGHQVMVPTGVGQAGRSDPKHLEYAIRNDLTLLTRNYKDFTDLHDLVLASGGEHPGILIVYFENDRRRDLPPRGIAAAGHQTRGVRLATRRPVALRKSMAITAVTRARRPTIRPV
jgi:predicted nuclease of predicted toxin-antitoxin system